MAPDLSSDSPDELPTTPGRRRLGQKPYALLSASLQADKDASAIFNKPAPSWLNSTDALCLLCLGEHADSALGATRTDDISSQANLARRTGMSQPSVSQKLTKLIGKGLVEVDPADDIAPLGVTLYRLTQAGLSLLDELFGSSERDPDLA